ncbi:hypothetical protein Ct61P_15102 [Colletotrichum tofieldiae]|nr:hypothetical protein Ct61P_15102 [Colletotrichum tofieldiae]
MNLPNLDRPQPEVSFSEHTKQPIHKRLPSVVAQITYSQSTIDVKNKARNYLVNGVGPDGTRIRLVVIMDIAYRVTPLSASVTVLRPPATADAEPGHVVHCRGSTPMPPPNSLKANSTSKCPMF